VATLIINTDSSYCLECGKGASSYDKTHIVALPGYSQRPEAKVGCGATFDKVRSDYVGCYIKEWAAENRPDLEWIGYEWDDLL
jgi:hypothetical protein